MCSPQLTQAANANAPTPTGSISKPLGGANTFSAPTAVSPDLPQPEAATPPPRSTIPPGPGAAAAADKAAPLPGDAPAATTAKGEISDFQTTHYGYPDDKTPDTNTKNKKGAFGPLTVGSLALSDDRAKALGAKPGDTIEIQDTKGNTHQGVYVDRVPIGGRIDIYDPTGSEAKGEPFKGVKARRIGSTANVLFSNTKG